MIPTLPKGKWFGFSVDVGDENGNGKPDVTVEIRFGGKPIFSPVTVDAPVAAVLDMLCAVAAMLPEPFRMPVLFAAHGIRSLVKA